MISYEEFIEGRLCRKCRTRCRRAAHVRDYGYMCVKCLVVAFDERFEAWKKQNNVKGRDEIERLKGK